MIFHFSRNRRIKFRPKAVGHASDDCFDYSPDNPKSASGSGLLGAGARGKAAGKPGAADDDGRRRGLARPSNVIEVKSESGQGAHSAPFPRALVEFFVKAFTDAGDIVFDPFMGSGTTMAAAAVLGRIGYGCEISPAYCDVIVRRIERAISQESANEHERVPILAATGRTFEQVAAERDIDLNAAADLRGRDRKSIRRKPNGMPCYAPRKAGADAVQTV